MWGEWFNDHDYSFDTLVVHKGSKLPMRWNSAWMKLHPNPPLKYLHFQVSMATVLSLPFLEMLVERVTHVMYYTTCMVSHIRRTWTSYIFSSKTLNQLNESKWFDCCNWLMRGDRWWWWQCKLYFGDFILNDNHANIHMLLIYSCSFWVMPMDVFRSTKCPFVSRVIPSSRKYAKITLLRDQNHWRKMAQTCNLFTFLDWSGPMMGSGRPPYGEKFFSCWVRWNWMYTVVRLGSLHVPRLAFFFLGSLTWSLGKEFRLFFFEGTGNDFQVPGWLSR